MNLFCIPEIFNTNISHQLFDYKISFVYTNLTGDFVLKKWIKVFFKDFWYTKINTKNNFQP